MSTRAFSIPVLVALLALGLSSCGESGSPTAPGGGGGGGNVPAGKELDSGLFAQGQTYEHVFRTAGTYPYHCEPHPDMVGSVTVTVGADSVANVSITGRVPFPAASVRPGGKVIWTNEDSMLHTVTSG